MQEARKHSHPQETTEDTAQVHSVDDTEVQEHTHIHTEEATEMHSLSHEDAQEHMHTHGKKDGTVYEHTHTHVGKDGTVYEHTHTHAGEEGHAHAHTHTHENTKAVLNRLARLIGHLESIKRMVEEGRDCSEVLIQLSAVKSAINNTGKVILQDHIQHCLVDAIESGDMQEIEELNKAIDRFIK